MSKIKVGDKFTLNCGVDVEVTQYQNADKVTVADSSGNSRVTTADSLRRGHVKWVINGMSVRRMKSKEETKKYALPKVGDRFLTKDSGWCTVLEVSANYMKITFENTGNIREKISIRTFYTCKLKDDEFKQRRSTLNRILLGARYTSRADGNFEIVDVSSLSKITIKWENTGNVQKNVPAYKIESRNVADSSLKVFREDYLKPTKGKYYVYIAKSDGVIVYIGHGIGKRYLHCSSGCSHSMGLNKLYFDGRKIVVELFKDGLEKEDACRIERELIALHRPSCNSNIPAYVPID